MRLMMIRKQWYLRGTSFQPILDDIKEVCHISVNICRIILILVRNLYTATYLGSHLIIYSIQPVARRKYLTIVLDCIGVFAPVKFRVKFEP